MRGERRRRESKREKEKKRAGKRAVLIILIIFAVTAALYTAYRIRMNGRFYHNTVLNGYDVSGKSVDEVAEELREPYSALTLCVTEEGRQELRAAFSDIGYTVNEEQMYKDIEDIMGRQGSVLAALIFGSEYGMRVPFDVDEDVFEETVSGNRFATPRVATENAQLVHNDGEYMIQPEVYGNDFDDSQLRSCVKDAIGKELMNSSVESVITVEVPKSIYRVPEITRQNESLNETMNLYNKYCKAEIVYDFGGEKQILDWETIREWITDDGEINEEDVYQYAENLAADYDSIYVERTFETSDGRTVTLPSNDYGYQIDIDGEFSQLLSDIYANTDVEREPVYAIKGFSRNGYDDLNGNYVEVNLTAQKLWFYRDGELIVQSDIISGLPKDDRETTQGAFAIPYKQSPANLTGQGGGEGESWDVEVKYWMPFHDGQGLHDASWQTNFGGTTYLTAGSHGCVNLPPDIAAVVYEHMEENMPIILYK